MNILELYANSKEYISPLRDKLDRHPSFVSNNPNLFEPTLSAHLHKEGFRPVYKDGKKAAVCFSHDIDFLYEPKNSTGHTISFLQALKSRQLKTAAYNFKSIFKPVPYNDYALQHLIDIELERNIRSTYYFLCLKSGEEDYNYDIKEVSKYFDLLSREGFEIGLHGGHEAYNNIDKLRAEKEILESVYKGRLVGYRNHYLRFATPQSWYNLKEVGFEYDTTYGFAEHPGYRNGMCYPHRPYDFVQKKFIDIIEIPLIVMDVSFFKYLNLNLQSAIELFNKIYVDVKKINGVLTVLWHNNCLQGEYGKLYKHILDVVCNDDELWITTSAEAAAWWKEHNLSKMEEIITQNII